MLTVELPSSEMSQTDFAANDAAELVVDEKLSDITAAYYGMMLWMSQHAAEIDFQTPQEQPYFANKSYAVYMTLSIPLSGAFNFGFEQADSSIALVVEPEEFEWLRLLPVEEFVVGHGQNYILTWDIDLGEEIGRFPPLIIEIQTDQPILWRNFDDSTTIKLAKIEFDPGAEVEDGYVVSCVSSESYPVRFLN